MHGGLKERTRLILQISTGGRAGAAYEQRCDRLRLKPEMASLWWLTWDTAGRRLQRPCMTRSLRSTMSTPHHVHGKSYHGLTLGALSATGKPALRVPFAPMLTEVIHIPAPYFYRCAFGLCYPDCGLRCAVALEEAIQQAGSETVSAKSIDVSQKKTGELVVNSSKRPGSSLLEKPGL
jgi:hypothetical protein